MQTTPFRSGRIVMMGHKSTLFILRAASELSGSIDHWRRIRRRLAASLINSTTSPLGFPSLPGKCWGGWLLKPMRQIRSSEFRCRSCHQTRGMARTRPAVSARIHLSLLLRRANFIQMSDIFRTETDLWAARRSVKPGNFWTTDGRLVYHG